MDVDAIQLSNGLRVALVSGAHLHRAAIAWVVRVGARFEDAQTAGLSHFLEHMLHRGTPSFPSAHALAMGIESLGASLDAATGIDRGTLTLTAPPDSLLDAMEVLGEITRQPLFTDIEVERNIVREELLEDRDDRGRLVDPDGLVRKLVFGEHPLGHPIVGTPRTLRSFSLPLLTKHHRRHYTVRSTVVALGGRLPKSRARLASALERCFGQTPVGRRVPAGRFVATRRASPNLSIVRTSASQASLRVACVGPGRAHAAAPAAELLLRVIDDGNATRLYERLCDGLGLCYEVSAGYEAYDEAGLFDIAAEAHEGTITQVLSEVLAMLRDLASKGPTPAEMEKAVIRARWQAARSLDHPETACEHVGSALLSDEPLTPFDRAERLAGVSTSAVRAMAARMFRADQLHIAVVGPCSRATERELRETVARFTDPRGS